MKIIPPKNVNYCATIVKIGNLVKLPKLDRVQGATVSGFSVVVANTAKVGDVGVFFPVETMISGEFLKANNLFSDPTLNSDPTKKGYISEKSGKGRLKCVAFQGNKSEGLFLSLDSLKCFLTDSDIKSLKVGDEFDVLGDTFVCEKYVPCTRSSHKNENQQGKYNRGEKKKLRLVESQFQFHSDTAQLKKNMHSILPDDVVSITNKKHGTSGIFGKPLVNRSLSLKDRIAKIFGVKVLEQEYGHIYSSRGVVKNKFVETNPEYIRAKNISDAEGTSDEWSVISRQIKDLIPDGMTFYGEILGYRPGGKAIQPGYTYGAEPGKCFFEVYRITQVNASGQFTELSYSQIKQVCTKLGLRHVEEFFYGKAKDIFPEIPASFEVNEDGTVSYSVWQDAVLAKLTESFNLERPCKDNGGLVPAEGIVFRKDNLYNFNAFKLKSYKFLLGEAKQLDSGEIDTETAESQG